MVRVLFSVSKFRLARENICETSSLGLVALRLSLVENSLVTDPFSPRDDLCILLSVSGDVHVR